MALLGSARQTSVVLLDIENGSVGSSLMRLTAGEAPCLFGSQRAETPLMDTRSAATLLRAVEHAADESLLRASETASRLRNAGTLPPVRKAVVFMAAPWGVPNLLEGRPDFSHTLLKKIELRARSLFGDVPVLAHAHMSAAVHGLRALYPDERDALILSVNGEVSELLLLREARVAGYASAPIGVHTVLRTLKSHAGLTSHEARSALRLATRPRQGKEGLNEALRAAAAHFASEFACAAREMFGTEERGRGSVFVLAHEPAGEWFARALADASLAELFPQGGVVRAMRPGHLHPFVGGHAGDAHLALGALYAHAAHAQ